MKLLLTLAALGAGLSNGAVAANPPLQDVIGKELSLDKVRGIYRYTCERTFLEGEGVAVNGDETTVSCRPNQRLGLIQAPYSFYLYDSKTASNEQAASNLSEKSTGRLKGEGGVCLKQVVDVSCPVAPQVRFGLYGERAGIFQVGVSLTSKPFGNTPREPTSAAVGFAALPDKQGNCAAGLVKIRPWTATPSSIVRGSLGDNPASSFVNINTALNEVQVEVDRPAPFEVLRQPNRRPCNGVSTDPYDPTGSCAKAEFKDATIVQAVEFIALSPVVCAIPAESLGGVIP